MTVAPPASGAWTSAPGPVVFARYAYPPNALGYCGPPDAAALLEASAGGGALAELAAAARRFEGAWPYLQLIAGCNGIADPLDARVVRAYWIGNPLLATTPAADLRSFLDERFGRRADAGFDAIARAAARGLMQHSFHVFAVYPWLGLLRAGHEGPALTVLDRCRIRWGTVVALNGDHAVVTSRPLAFEGARLTLGQPTAETVRWRSGPLEPAGPLAAGDVVSLHWDWVCERLPPEGVAALRRCTQHNLDVANGLPVPGPASVCDALGG